MGSEVSPSRHLLWRTLIVAATTVFLLAVYIGVAFLLRKLFPNSENQMEATVLILVVVAALLVAPLQKLHQLFVGEKSSASFATPSTIPITPTPSLDNLFARVGQAETLDMLAVELVTTLRQDLQLTFAAFTLYSEVDKLMRFDYVKFDGDNKYEPFFRRLAFRPIQQFNVPEMAPGEGDFPQNGIVMKLKVGDGARGMLCLGAHQDGSQFQPHDLALIRRLANPLTVMINNNLEVKELAEKVAVLEESNRQLRRSQNELQLINQRMVQEQEQERNEIARSLQTDALQKLKQISDHFRQDMSNLTEQEEMVWHQAREVNQALLAVISRLRPASLDSLGLAAALYGKREELLHKVKMSVKVKVAPELEDRRLPSEVEVGLFRVAEEAIENVLKHARAHHVTITLSLSEAGETVRLVVLDDGVGFEPPSEFSTQGHLGHLGLAGMQERLTTLGGRLNVRSSKGAGAIVEAEVPLQAAALSAGRLLPEGR